MSSSRLCSPSLDDERDTGESGPVPNDVRRSMRRRPGRETGRDRQHPAASWNGSAYFRATVSNLSACLRLTSAQAMRLSPASATISPAASASAAVEVRDQFTHRPVAAR